MRNDRLGTVWQRTLSGCLLAEIYRLSRSINLRIIAIDR
jgi:hypothetical protein